jgi:Helix-turn-helix domain
MSNLTSFLTSFMVLAGLLFFPGPAPANEVESIAALCARRDLQAVREARQEMTVRDTAAATGIKESTLRQLLKGLGNEGEIRCGG